MTTHDEYPRHQRDREDIPTMTMAEPRSERDTERTDRVDQTVDHTENFSAPIEYGEQGNGSAVDEDRHGGERHDVESRDEATLFADDELAGLRARWDGVQAGFVDDPRDCVQRADRLVSDVVGQLTTGFTEARSRLEQQWGRGEEASTEDLRVALTRYRDFFDRLLAV